MLINVGDTTVDSNNADELRTALKASWRGVAAHNSASTESPGLCALCRNPYPKRRHVNRLTRRVAMHGSPEEFSQGFYVDDFGKTHRLVFEPDHDTRHAWACHQRCADRAKIKRVKGNVGRATLPGYLLQDDAPVDVDTPQVDGRSR